MVQIQPRLKKLIFEKLDSDLADVIYHTYGSELWILNPYEKSWFLVGESKGTVWFNEKFFKHFFYVFSMDSKKYSVILKEWFESRFQIPVRMISRKNTNYDYVVEQVVKRSNKDYEWSLNNRWGFSYPVVKKYLQAKKVLQSEQIMLKDIISYE